MAGGPSQHDLFDFKPRLARDHGKPTGVRASDKLISVGLDKWLTLGPMAKFAPRGKSGLLISDLLPKLAGVADELCLLKGMQVDNIAHDLAMLQFNTGTILDVRPSMGSWVSYGLGTENRNLPSFVVIAPAVPYAGTQNWGSDFLPGCHQGTQVIPGQQPLPNIKPGVPQRELQEMELELLTRLNRKHQKDAAPDRALEARIRSFETAFGMQREAPEAFDIARNRRNAQTVRRQARATPMALAGNASWPGAWSRRGAFHRADRHRFRLGQQLGFARRHERPRKLARPIDQPIAGLIADLKRRGLLDSTLVVWTTEFGRTPFKPRKTPPEKRGSSPGFPSWLAGGGVKKGIVHGQSDDHGTCRPRNAFTFTTCTPPSCTCLEWTTSA